MDGGRSGVGAGGSRRHRDGRGAGHRRGDRAERSPTWARASAPWTCEPTRHRRSWRRCRAGPTRRWAWTSTTSTPTVGLVEGAAAELGPIQALVLAAGVLKREPFTDVTEEAWDWQLDTNLKASFFLSRTVGEHMREAGTHGQHLHLHLHLRHHGRRQLGTGVRRVEGRRHRAHLRHGPSLRTGRHPRQQHRSWFHRHAHAASRLLARGTGLHRQHAAGAPGRPGRGRRRWRSSWPLTTPAS